MDASRRRDGWPANDGLRPDAVCRLARTIQRLFDSELPHHAVHEVRLSIVCVREEAHEHVIPGRGIFGEVLDLTR